MKKNEYWQIIRGICIIAVILIHCPAALNSPSAAERLSWITVRSAVNFAVPVFFFLAGYFALPSREKFRSGIQYVAERSGRLIVPYTVWSALYVLLLAAVRHRFPSAPRLAAEYFTGQTVTPFYYIAALFQLTLITPLLTALARRKSRLIYIAYGLQITALAVVYRLALTRNIVPYYCYTLLFVWAGFYTLGIQARASESEESYPRFRRLLTGILGSPLLLPAAFLANWLESCVLLKNGVTPNLAVCQFRIGGVLYSAALIGMIYRFRAATVRNRFCKGLARIGDLSYGIFYVHYMAILAASAGFGRLFPRLPWCVTFAAVFTLTLSVSVTAVCAVRRIFKGARGEKILRAVGFA